MIYMDYPARQDTVTVHGSQYSGGAGCTTGHKDEITGDAGVCTGCLEGVTLSAGEYVSWRTGRDNTDLINYCDAGFAQTSLMAGWELCFA